ncbi:hypothetical protein Tco_0783756 [Tanacetum coccineum]
MEISIADQIALDDALVAPADRLKIGKCNLRLSSDVTSKEATLQVVYDASAYVHNRSVRFKMNNKKHILGLDQFRDILQICPKVDPSIPRRNQSNWHYARDDPMFTTINVISRNEDTQLYGAILPVALTNEDIRNSESYKEYYAIASGTIPPKTKGSKKKANTDTITKQKPPTAPKEKKSGKGKQKTTELETISEADLTEAEQLKIITKRSRQETHSSHASGSGADEGTGATPGVPDAPDYDSEDDISWKSSDDDQDDEQAQDDEDADKNDVNETKQDDEDDEEHDDNETDQNDDDEEQTESDDDGDDFVHPKLTTHDDDIIHEEETDEDDSFDPTIHTPSRISSSDDEDSDNEVEGANVEGAKSDEDATYEEDQGNEAVEDTNTDLDGRDDVMTDVILPQVQATQEIEDTHIQGTGVDDIFGQHTEATSLIDTPITAIMEPSVNLHKPIALQTPIPSVRRQPLGTQKNNIQYAEALSSIPSIVDQYLANKMQSSGRMKKIIKEQVKKEVSKITPKIEKLVTDQLESEVLVRSSKGKPSPSHVVRNSMKLYRHLLMRMKPTQILNRGSKRRRSGKEPASTSAPSETTTKTAGKTTSTGSKTHKKSASQSAPVEETMQTTDVFEAPAHQEFETGVHDEQAEEEVQHLPDWFQQPTRLPSPDHAWNKSVPAIHESVQPWLSNLAQQDPRESMKFFKAQQKKLGWINLKVAQYLMICEATTAEITGISNVSPDRILSANSMWSHMDSQIWTLALWGSRIGAKKRRTVYAFAPQGNQLETSIQTDEGVGGKIFNWVLKAIKKKLTSQSMTRQIQSENERCYTTTPIQEDFIYENKDKKKQIDAALTNYTVQRCYKAVRLRFSDPMIQPEPEGSTQGYPLVSVEVLSDAYAQTLPATQKSERLCFKNTHGDTLISSNSLTPSKLIMEKNIRVNSFTMKMEILLEPTSNKLIGRVPVRFYMNHKLVTNGKKPDGAILIWIKRVPGNGSNGWSYSRIRRLLKMVVEIPDSSLSEVLKLKNFKKDATFKAFQDGMRCRPESQVHKMAKVSRWAKECDLVNDLRCSRSHCQIQVQGTSLIQGINDHYNLFTREKSRVRAKRLG